jgi:hypothetical protein
VEGAKVSFYKIRVFATELRAETTPDALGDDLIGDTT